MTIEQKIYKLLEKPFSIPPNKWIWSKRPMSIICSENSKSFNKIKKYWNKIDNAIRKADASECLTSNSEYIRECKKWFMENN